MKSSFYRDASAGGWMYRVDSKKWKHCLTERVPGSIAQSYLACLQSGIPVYSQPISGETCTLRPISPRPPHLRPCLSLPPSAHYHHCCCPRTSDAGCSYVLSCASSVFSRYRLEHYWKKCTYYRIHPFNARVQELTLLISGFSFLLVKMWGLMLQWSPQPMWEHCCCPWNWTGPLSSPSSSSFCQAPAFGNHWCTLCLYRFGRSGYCI